MSFKLPTRVPRILPPLLPDLPGKPVNFVRGQRVFPKGPDQWQPRVIEAGGKFPKLPEIEGMLPGGAIAKTALFLAGVAEVWWNLHEAAETEPAPVEPLRIVDSPPAGKTLPHWLHEMAELATLTTLIAEKELRAFQLEKLGLSHEARQLRDEIEGLQIQLLTASRTYPVIHGALQAVASAGANGQSNTASVPETTAPVGTPPAQDLPMLLEHLGPMIQRGRFGDYPFVKYLLTMVFNILEQEANPESPYRQQAIVLARDAALCFKDMGFLVMAQRAAEALPPTPQQIVVTDLENAATEIRPFQLPEHLLQRLRKDIQDEHELRVEDTVNQLSDFILDTCRKLIDVWGDAEKAVSWAEHQIDEVAREVREAAVSVARRSLVHDAVNTLGLIKSLIRLTAAEEPGHIVALGAQQPAISRNLDSMVTSLKDMNRSSARLTATGFQGKYLVETVDGRDMFVTLRNLVGNARQHPKDGQGPVDIHLTLTQSATGTTITVGDNGAGMTAETATNLLAGQPMHDGQVVDYSDPNEFHGFGWLRIREACARLGIVPEIHSTPGQGTTVTLHLPRGLLKSDTPSPAEQAARAQLKDPDPAEQWEAWKDLYALNPDAARAITQNDLGPPLPAIQGTGGVGAFFIIESLTHSQARAEVGAWRDKHHTDSDWQSTTVSIDSLHPSEGVMDFLPEHLHFPGLQPVMAIYSELLGEIVSRRGLNDPQAVLEEYFGQHWTRQSGVSTVSAIQMPSGYRVLRNGHHRLAALVKAAREGIIPKEWLQQVPIELLVIKEDFPIPEPVFLQIYAPAHRLSMEDLLPPPGPK